MKIDENSSQNTITDQEQQFYFENRIIGRRKLLNKYRQETENKIFEIVRIYSLRDGISHQELADKMELHRTNLQPYTDSLMEKNKISRKNKKSKYFVTQDIFKDPILNASIFADTVRFKLLKNTDKFLILNEDISFIFSNDHQDKEYFKNFITYKNFFQPNFTKNQNLEKMLFEFSNRIGSFITYLLIYSMNFNKMNRESVELTDKEKDEIIQRMVEEGITNLIPYLPHFFKDTVNKALGNFPRFNFEKRLEYFKKNPKLVFDPDINNKLIDAFTKLYPLMSYEFEKILPQQFRLIYGKELKGWVSAIEEHKKYLNEFHEKLREQRTCKHEYIKKSKTSRYQCKLCNHIKKTTKLKL
jgi:hypothetical protein